MFIVNAITNTLKRMLASVLVAILSHRRGLSSICLVLCLGFVGSCNENSSMSSVCWKSLWLLIEMSPKALQKYAYAIQDSVVQSPERIALLRQKDVELAFSQTRSGAC